MKKFIKLFILAIILCVPVLAKADTKANVYLFRGEGCPHCENAINFFNELSEDEEYKNYFSLVQYEVWYDDDNQGLLKKVGEKLDTTVSGVPFIVIGDKYFSGYSENSNDKLKEAIKENYQKYVPTDVVNQAKIEYDIDKAKENISDAIDDVKENIKDNTLISGNDSLISDYDYDISDFDDDEAALLAIFTLIPAFLFSGVYLVVMILIFVVAIFIALIRIILLWRIFVKAGKPGWAALIPIYNYWVFFEVAGLPGWLSLLGLIPGVNAFAIKVLRIVCYFFLVKRFNKEWWFALVLIFVEIVGLAILAFDSSVYTAEEKTENVKDANYKEAPKKEIAEEVKEEKKED